MLAALRGVLRERWHAVRLTTDEYQAAIQIPAVRGESEARGRDLTAGDCGDSLRPALGPLRRATARTPGPGPGRGPGPLPPSLRGAWTFYLAAGADGHAE